jgi:hypothetical protein
MEHTELILYGNRCQRYMILCHVLNLSSLAYIHISNKYLVYQSTSFLNNYSLIYILYVQQFVWLVASDEKLGLGLRSS